METVNNNNLRGGKPTVPIKGRLGVVLSGILAVVWVVISSLVGSSFVLFLFNGFSTSSSILFLFAFLVPGVIIGIIAAFPFFKFTRRLSAKSLLQNGSRVAMFILALTPSALLFFLTGLLGVWFIPFPAPPDADSMTYKFEVTGGLGPSPETTFSFGWDTNLSLEEKVEKMQRTARFYQDFAQRRGWSFDGYSNALGRSVPCEDEIVEDYQFYLKERERVKKELLSPLVYAQCSFEVKGTGVIPYINLTEDGGEISLN